MSSSDNDSSNSSKHVPLAMLSGKNLRSPDNGNDSSDDDNDTNDDESSYTNKDESNDERGENGDASFESESDDDVPLSALKSVKPPTKKKKSTSFSSSSSKKKKTPAKENRNVI
eukprot:2916231-Ditylum_brightwellii.AAC.1